MSSAEATKITTINDQEISQFAQDSHLWWDENGPFAPLHKMNPVRIGYIKDQILGHFDKSSLNGISILDVGCGGGLACEPLSRLGADVSGLDADAQAISVASEHASTQGLNLTYTQGSIEHHDQQYDVVMALEIIEHVDNPADFVQLCAARVKPGGLLIMSTINRTPQSFLKAIVGAEYILRWVPAGTHNWQKFFKPSELASMMRSAGLQERSLSGVTYNPITDSFSLHDNNVCVNYLLSATNPLG